MGGCPAHRDQRGSLTIGDAGAQARETSEAIRVRDITAADRPTLRRLVTASWGTTRSAAHGRLIDVTEVEGLVAERDGAWIGYLAYEVVDDAACEVVLLESVEHGQGAGTALLQAIVAYALQRSWSRLWLITSNDNTDALRWYQRRGFVLAALHRDAITRSRDTVKPEIPELGDDDIPIRDELELELPPAAWDTSITAAEGRP